MFSGTMAASGIYVPFIYLLLACFSTAQVLDPVEDHCARWHHQSTIKGGFLYIDGGVETFRYDGGRVLGYNQKLLRVDVRDSWNSYTNITILPLAKRPNPETGSSPPSLVRGTLFQGPANASEIYMYGGTIFLGNKSFPVWPGQESDTYALWSYSTPTQSWNQYDVRLASPQRPNRGASAEAPALGLAFYLNGQMDSGSSLESSWMMNTTEHVEGMIVLSTVDQSMANVSTTTLGSPRVAGGLQFIEQMATNGALVAIGGLQRSGESTQLVSFDHVHLCDDFTEKSTTWYRQATTGEIPPPRSDFCVVTASAPDNSSHNIYIYGGIDTTNGTMHDDVYVLSLPSFIWIHIYGPGHSPRWGHTCHLVGGRQMLTVGGSLDGSIIYNVETAAQDVNTSSLTCDWESKGVAVFDMTALKWGSVFDAYKPAYQVPSVIASVIGGNENGSATMTAPATGFAEAAVSTMFAQRAAPSATATSSGDGSSPSEGNNTGFIAGAVVAGVVGLSVVVGVALYMLHRRKTQQEEACGVGIPNAELVHDASRYELASRSRTPEIMARDLTQELPGDAKPVELGDNSIIPLTWRRGEQGRRSSV